MVTITKIETLHQGFHTYEERHYVNEDGRTFSREVLISKDAVASFVYHVDKDRYGFVRQFRAGANQEMVECVAGAIDDGENPLDALRREVREELGVYLIKSEYLGCIEQGPATVSGKLHLFYSEVAGEFEQSLDFDEEVEILWVTEEEYSKMTFTDMKTLILTLKHNEKHGG